MVRKYIFLSIVIIGFFSIACNRKKIPLPQPDKSEVKEIQKKTEIKIKRYEQALYNIPKDSLESGLKRLQSDYYFFLGDNPASEENLRQIKSYLNDKIIRQLYAEVQKQIPDLSDMEQEFADAFSLLLYYFPNSAVPQIYTAITGLYYEMPIMYYDTTLVISLDLFLGKDYKLYNRLPDVPQFIQRRFSKEYIVPSSFSEISYHYITSKDLQSNLLDEMILEGKRMLFLEMILPNTPDSLIFPFPQEKINWVKENEVDIWAYLIQNNHLYSRDKMVIRKLVNEAAFTSYFGKQSPGKVAAWIGWQICRSWVEKNPQKSIEELFQETDAQKILTESKYKPKK